MSVPRLVIRFQAEGQGRARKDCYPGWALYLDSDLDVKFSSTAAHESAVHQR